MKGILVISHGEFAKGMLNSAELFMGRQHQLDFLCLQAEDDPLHFQQRIMKKVEELDAGDGVVILADLFGGTPCNQALRLCDKRIDVVAGVNFALLLELLSKRMFETDLDIHMLLQTGKQGIVDAKAMIEEYDEDE